LDIILKVIVQKCSRPSILHPQKIEQRQTDTVNHQLHPFTSNTWDVAEATL